MRNARRSAKMRATIVSSVTPCPPSTCTQRSTTRQVASDTMIVARELALVEHPRAVQRHKACDVQVHLVVGKHEADAFVLADRLAECVPPASVVGGDVMCAPRGPQP